MNNSLQPDQDSEEKSHETNGNADSDRHSVKAPLRYASREELIKAAKQYARAAESYIPDEKDKELLKD
ncbi:MAG TPA: hypothetical protein VFH95_09485 [Candidatus Kapabacteria bacterium]|nr:hypothetical protein [Candidatus Kapabacteria bacterium]